MKPEFDPYAKFAIFHVFGPPDHNDPYEDSRMIRKMVMKEMKKEEKQRKQRKQRKKMKNVRKTCFFAQKWMSFLHRDQKIDG